jgi:uncharacterized protein YlbG (UPF0298 family)
MKKTFYVCSYGGSGSTMLTKSLKKFGNVEHVHSRNPPDKLQYIGKNGGGDAFFEWFNGIDVPDDEIENYYVIYIYRNPSFAIPSKFENPIHLRNIECDTKIRMKNVIDSSTDLYKINEFYNNYTSNKKRNYIIYSIKYEEIFDKQDELSKLLGIGKLNLINKSVRTESNKELDEIYKDLINTMNNNSFIMIN